MMTNTNTTTANEVKIAINNTIATLTDATEIARLEVVREYLTNAEFRANLENYTWEANN